MNIEKRKRGGQPGNQNARKHGFYSASLNQGEICEFLNLTNLQGVDREMAVLRLKAKSVLDFNPSNRRVLLEISKLTAAWYAAKYGLDRTGTNLVKKVIIRIFDNYSASPAVSPNKI